MFVGKYENGEFYNGIMVFMVVSLKKSIPFVIKSWFSSQITESIETLSNPGFVVRAVVYDNHSINVNVFSVLKKEYVSNPSDLFISYPYIEKRFMYFTTRCIC